jgi:hypothetical protein
LSFKEKKSLIFKLKILTCDKRARVVKKKAIYRKCIYTPKYNNILVEGINN